MDVSKKRKRSDLIREFNKVADADKIEKASCSYDALITKVKVLLDSCDGADVRVIKDIVDARYDEWVKDAYDAMDEFNTCCKCGNLNCNCPDYHKHGFNG